MIAQRKHDPAYLITLSRLSDIENEEALPTLCRIYTLCAVYRLDLYRVLRWYGIEIERLPGDENFT